EPGSQHWSIFTRLCREAGANGNLVADAWDGALAVESGCEWVTLIETTRASQVCDGGFHPETGQRGRCTWGLQPPLEPCHSSLTDRKCEAGILHKPDDIFARRHICLGISEAGDAAVGVTAVLAELH